jgi:hypothetical protein
MQRMLKLKHWQLFILTAGSSITTNLIIAVHKSINPATIGFYQKYERLLTLPWILFYILWVFGIGIIGENKLQKNSHTHSLFMKILLVIVLTVTISIRINLHLPNQLLRILIMGNIIAPLCVLYALVVAAKMLKSIELGRRAFIGDYFREFCLLFIFPIGIWVLQPTINHHLGLENKTNTVL